MGERQEGFGWGVTSLGMYGGRRRASVGGREKEKEESGGRVTLVHDKWGQRGGDSSSLPAVWVESGERDEWRFWAVFQINSNPMFENYKHIFTIEIKQLAHTH